MGIQMSGLVSNMDTENIIKELMKAQKEKTRKLENQKTKLTWTQDKWKTLNSKIYSFYTGSLNKAKMQGSFQTKKVSSSNTNKVEVTASSSAPEGTHIVQVNKLASAQFITGSKVDSSITGSTKLETLSSNGGATTFRDGTEITIKAGSNSPVTLKVDSNTTVNDFISSCQKAGLSCQLDSTQNRFFISSRESGYKNAFSINTNNSDNSLSLLGLSEITTTTDADGVATTAYGPNVSCVNSSDASIKYNGVTITGSSNTITANGLTLTVKAVTDTIANGASADETINLTVTNDTKAVYDMIKGFVKSYNELLGELNDDFYADTARGYDPLTDEQKESMTDDQITKWEDKIKKSLLRRDSSAGTIIDAMRSSFTGNVKVGDKAYSLSSFGIGTTDYLEKGKLHIDGDTDDSATAAKPDKLMKALNENPDAVMEVFNKFAGKLYDTMTEKMSRTELNSSLTFYNDKEMKKTLDDYNKRLDVMNDRIDEQQKRYYKQFTAMEVALSKLNSQNSSLSSMLGTNK